MIGNPISTPRSRSRPNTLARIAMMAAANAELEGQAEPGRRRHHERHGRANAAAIATIAVRDPYRARLRLGQHP